MKVGEKFKMEPLNEKTWRPIKNYQRYEVSNFGEIRNTKTGRILKKRNGHEYPTVTLYNRDGPHDMQIHRAVAETFYDGDHSGLDVNHKDGCKTNNNVDNLEWCTRSENLKHAYRTRLKKPSGPYETQRVKVVETGIVYESLRECARNIGGCQSHISRCVAGERDSHKGYHFERVIQGGDLY